MYGRRHVATGRVGRWAVAALLLGAFALHAADELSPEQVKWLMPQVMQMHLTRPQMNVTLVKRLIKNFLVRLDATHTLYLQPEADKRLKMSDADLEALAQKLNSGELTYFTDWLKEFKAEQLARDQAWLKTLKDQRAQITRKVERAEYDAIDFESYPATEEDRQKRIALFANRDYQLYKEYLSEDEAFKYAVQTMQKRRDEWDGLDPEVVAPNNVMKAFMQALDPHSEYMDAKDIAQFETSMARSFAGVGIQIRGCPLGVQILDIIKDGPAARSGKFDNGDQIIAVDGEYMAGKSMEEIVNKIKGEKGSKVRLTVRKVSKDGQQEKTDEITVIRDTIDLAALRVTGKKRETPAGPVGVIAVQSFYNDVHKDVLARIKELSLEKPLAGLVLDLRNNSGGLLQEAVALAGLFIGEGPVVSERDAIGRDHWSGDTDEKIHFDQPVVVLVNQYSASAAEIVTGALRDYGRAIVVGHTQTHGKGTVQRVLDLNRPPLFLPGRLKLTYQQYFLAGGDSVQIQGVKPDITIPGLPLLEDQLEKNYEGALPFASIKGAEGTLSFEHVDAKRWRPWKEQVLPVLNAASAKRVAENKEFEPFRKAEAEAAERALAKKEGRTLEPKPETPDGTEPKAPVEGVQATTPEHPAPKGEEPKDPEDPADPETVKEEDRKDPQLDETVLILSDAIAEWKKKGPEE